MQNFVLWKGFFYNSDCSCRRVRVKTYSICRERLQPLTQNNRYEWYKATEKPLFQI